VADYLSNILRYFVLQVKKVACITVVAFSPQVLVGSSADELGSDTNTVANTFDRALDEPVSYVAIGPVFATASKQTGYEAIGLARVADASRRAGRSIALVTDEPYRRIAFDGPVPWVFPSYANTILVTSHSKDLALPGERIGFIAASPSLEGADEFVAGATFATRTLGFVNAPAIQQRAVATLQGVTVDPAIYRRKRDRLWGALTSMGYDIVKPGGAFYLFPRTLHADDVAFVRELQAERILTVPGVGFGRRGHLRISYCVEDETIERALPGFERVAKRYVK